MEEEQERSTLVVERIIQEYPNLKAKYDRLKVTSSTVCYEPGGHGSGDRKDPTADAALRELPPKEQQQYDAVRIALRRTQRLPQCTIRLVVIKLTYWQGRLSLTEIADKLNLSTQVLSQYRTDFIRTVKELLHASNCDGCVYFRPLTAKIKACHYCADTGELRLYTNKESTQCQHYCVTGGTLKYANISKENM